jgi:F420-dependent oxidoreductase-like protein
LSKIKFSLLIPQGWRWLDYNGISAIEQYAFTKEIVHMAETYGYNSAYAYDHLWGGANFRDNHDKNFFECFTLLSSLIPITQKIRLGQIVTSNSYRNPALLAKMISTMDVISKGRMDLGIGAGWYEDEYTAFGYQYPRSYVRIKQLDEALNVIKLLWIQPTATFLGDHYVIRDAVCNPKPIQKPHPPIMIGGTGEKHLLKTVARHGNSYNHPFAPPSQLRNRLTALKDHCNTLGRDYHEIELSVLIRCLIRENEDELHNEIIKAKTENESTDAFERRVSAFVGTPERLSSKLHDYMDLGITHFIIHFVGLNEQALKAFNSIIRTI